MTPNERTAVYDHFEDGCTCQDRDMPIHYFDCKRDGEPRKRFR